MNKNDYLNTLEDLTCQLRKAELKVLHAKEDIDKLKFKWFSSIVDLDKLSIKDALVINDPREFVDSKSVMSLMKFGSFILRDVCKETNQFIIDFNSFPTKQEIEEVIGFIKPVTSFNSHLYSSSCIAIRARIDYLAKEQYWLTIVDNKYYVLVETEGKTWIVHEERDMDSILLYLETYIC